MTELTKEIAIELLDYTPEPGDLIWKHRSRKWFNTRGWFKKWNSTYPNTNAGRLTPNGYIKITIFGKCYFSHRLIWLIMTGKWPANQIDHINHIRTDNRWENLREATRQENNRNRTLLVNSTTGVMGVTFDRNASKYKAQIKINGITKYLGLFNSLSDAATARQEADIKHGFHPNHGDNR